MSPAQASTAPAAPTGRGSAGFVVTLLPILAAAAWVGALVCIFVLGLNRVDLGNLGTSRAVIYGWKAPIWAVAGLVTMSAVFFGVAAWRRDLPWSYATAAPLVPLGTGDLLIVRDLPKMLAFAACVFLIVEYLSGIRRFEQIALATRTLEQEEAKPVKTFVTRYLAASALLAAVYSGFLYAFITFAVPAASGSVSQRMKEGLENETAWGITLFAVLFFAVPLTVRLVWDGVAQYREQRERARKDSQSIAAEPGGARAGGST